MTVRETEVKVDKSPTRCPYCHDGIAEADLEATIVCQGCLSRHHRDCWLGGCASCKAVRPLVTVTLLPGNADATYERVKRFLNRSFLVAIPVLGAAILCAALVFPHSEGAVKGVLALFIACGALGYTTGFLNTYDAFVRSARDPSTGLLPVIAALSGLLTWGLASSAYYLRWGSEPLPQKQDTVRPRPPEEKA